MEWLHAILELVVDGSLDVLLEVVEVVDGQAATGHS